jgi:hypothetical protein
MTLREMCDDIAAELKRRGITIQNKVTGKIMESGQDIYEFDSHGGLGHVHDLYWGLFPERLPRDVSNPQIGDVRFNPVDARCEAWCGNSWIPI